MAKVKLNQRIDQDVYDRLMHLKARQKIELSDLILSALDALEREQRMAETIVEQVEDIRHNLTEFMTRFDEKMEEASVNEKERLRSLLKLIESRLVAHDEAEQDRFAALKAAAFLSGQTTKSANHRHKNDLFCSRRPAREGLWRDTKDSTYGLGLTVLMWRKRAGTGGGICNKIRWKDLRVLDDTAREVP